MRRGLLVVVAAVVMLAGAAPDARATGCERTSQPGYPQPAIERIDCEATVGDATVAVGCGSWYQFGVAGSYERRYDCGPATITESRTTSFDPTILEVRVGDVAIRCSAPAGGVYDECAPAD